MSVREVDAEDVLEHEDHENRRRYFEGGFLIILNPPPAFEFGIDYEQWTTDVNFRGLKMIPAGLHFITYSAVDASRMTLTEAAPTTGFPSGFFHSFEPREILVRRWDPETETLEPAATPADQTLSFTRDLDAHLAPYPLAALDRWRPLSWAISTSRLQRLCPPPGHISSAPSVLPSFGAAGTPDADEYCGLFFTPIDLRRSFPRDADPATVTKYSLDKSYLLRSLLESPSVTEVGLLCEMQVAFLAFVLVHAHGAFQQWKRILVTFSAAGELMRERPRVFVQFADVLSAHMKLLPRDFFEDPLSKQNFLGPALRTFIETAVALGSGGGSGNSEDTRDLVARAREIDALLFSRFGWSALTGYRKKQEDSIDMDEDEDEDEMPVVVDLDEPLY